LVLPSGKKECDWFDCVKDGITGFLVEPNNPVDLAERIEILLTNDTFAREMGQHWKKRYEKYFSLEKYYQKIDDIYTSLLR